jgi:hypothetical protein
MQMLVHATPDDRVWGWFTPQTLAEHAARVDLNKADQDCSDPGQLAVHNQLVIETSPSFHWLPD